MERQIEREEALATFRGRDKFDLVAAFEGAFDDRIERRGRKSQKFRERFRGEQSMRFCRVQFMIADDFRHFREEKGFFAVFFDAKEFRELFDREAFTSFRGKMTYAVDSAAPRSGGV